MTIVQDHRGLDKKILMTQCIITRSAHRVRREVRVVERGKVSQETDYYPFFDI